MERLWSPWRLAYVTGASGERPACIFCDALADPDARRADPDPRPRSRFVILNLYPYNNGHLMVVPNGTSRRSRDRPPTNWPS